MNILIRRGLMAAGAAALPSSHLPRPVCGQRFGVDLTNDLDVPVTIHWHGQIPPDAPDGVPDLGAPPAPIHTAPQAPAQKG